MSDEELSREIGRIRVITRSTPVIKMRVVNALKAQGNVVAVTGDGINDAPAIKNADVGIAMGIAGTEVSKEATYRDAGRFLCQPLSRPCTGAVAFTRISSDSSRSSSP